jgi:arabinofuranosyltransferase
VRWRRWIQPAFLISLLAIAARLVPGPRVIDDAYITFRYARNLLAGNGLVFNPGEAVFGTTTPLYTLLMATIGAFGGGANAAFPTIALVVNALADGLTCWLLILLGDALGHRRAGIAAALVWAVAPMSVTFAIGGMETSIFIALATGTFYLYLTDRPVAAALCAGLSLVTRPDALLFILPLAVDRFRRGGPMVRTDGGRTRGWLGEVIAFGAPVVAWGVAGTILYGNPLPHSIAAKVQAYLLPPEAALVRLLQHYATPFLGHLTLGIPWIGVGLFLYPILFVLGAVMVVRERRRAWAVMVYPWVYFAVFAAANPLIFRWYLVPPLPVYFLGIFLGVDRLTREIRFRPAAPMVIAAALVLTLRGWTLRPDHGPSRPAPAMAYIQLESLYERVAEELLPRLAPGDTLAAGDIGALGYYTNAHILDTIGLISPVSLGYYPIPEEEYVINYAIPARLIDEQQPEWVVILEVYGRNTLLKDPRFLASYRLTDEIPTDIYGSKAMLVFQRESQDD